MESFGFGALGTAGNTVAFLAATIVVWVAGGRLARYASIIAERTALGQAFVGVAFLGFLVSLPNLALSATAAAFGQAALAVNTLIGGVGICMVMLAVVDVVVKREALSRYVDEPVVLLQGALTAIMLAIGAAAIVAGDRLLPVTGRGGYWTAFLFAFYFVALWIVRAFQRRRGWTPDRAPSDAEMIEGHAQEKAIALMRRDEKHSLAAIGALASLASIAVLISGAILAASASALPEQIGWSAGFVGFLLGGVSTSLPNLSTALAAARLNRFDMSFMNIFGGNQCGIALLFIADLFSPEGPILNEVGVFSTFALLLGCVLTLISLAGLVARVRWRLLDMGTDSVAIFIFGAIGLALLYRLS